MSDRTISTRNIQTGLTYDFLISRLPETSFFLQTFEIPEISGGVVEQLTPFNPVPLPGTNLEYSPANFTFLMQEGLRNWYDIYIWIHGLNFPQSFTQYVKLKDGLDKSLDNNLFPNTNDPRGNLYSDIQVIVKSSQGNPLLQYTFVDAFPTILSAPQLDATADTFNALTFTASFRYSYFTISDDF